MSTWGSDGFARRPGEGVRVDQTPHWLEVLVRGAETDGRIGVFEFRHEPITELPPHAHLGWTKIAYVLEGKYHFRVGDAEMAGGPGTVVHVPQGSHHAFTTPTGGRLLFVCTPAGNEEMFLELGRLDADVAPDTYAEIRSRYRTVVPDGELGMPWRPDSEE